MGQSASSADPAWTSSTVENMQQSRAAHPVRNSRAAAAPPRRLNDQERAILWEINIARGCLTTFSELLGAHAIVFSLLVTVNLIGFLQPPKGWQGDTGVMFVGSGSVKAFAVANSLSLYTAIAGLLFYIYCSYATIVSLGAVPLTPDRFDDRGVELLRVLRAAMRCVALPSVKYRSYVLFAFLAFSLTFCVIAYISAGIASTNPDDRFLSVILPAIPGCLLILFVLHLTASKLRMELNFEHRFELLWSKIVQIDPPDVISLDEGCRPALDPAPTILWCANVPKKCALAHHRRNNETGVYL